MGATTAKRYGVQADSLTTHIVEDRRAVVSPWGRGNSKIGPGIYTYSKLPAVTCPGASQECLDICYAIRAAKTNGWVERLWRQNSLRGDELPPLPSDAKIVRFHISGDFDTAAYVRSWSKLALENAHVTFYGYTRSWRVTRLLGDLDFLRLLPNVFVWASIDQTILDLPSPGWRRAWIEGDDRLIPDGKHYRTFDGRRAIVCPEEAGRLPNCQTCRFCFLPHDTDLVFLKH